MKVSENKKRSTGFSVHTGNCLNRLFDRMCAEISNCPDDPFKPEIIVVQSQGMRKWLSLKIADRTGIAAGYEFIFPNALITLLFSGVLDGVSSERFVDQERDVWRTMAAVTGKIDLPLFAEISSYLGSPVDNLKLYQLASKLTDLFDQYITYRPEMILDWDSGGGAEEWQSHIWRELYPAPQKLHPPALKKLFEKTVSENAERAALLPRRISLFGIPALPRFHTELFYAASSFSKIDIYFLNPSGEFWLDTRSAAAASRAAKRHSVKDSSSLHFETGHPLLSSMGRYSGEYLNYLMSSGIDITEGFNFINPEKDSLLAKIQRDIQEMRPSPEPGKREKIDEKQMPNDCSISINSCHSPMREMETLKDYLLESFEKDPGLLPSEVIVLSPDIEKYVPYINAVFGKGISGHYIPYSIVDRKPTDDTPEVRTLSALLELPQTRVTASAVAKLLEFDSICEARGFSGQDTAEITNWIAASGIRWGIDSDDRSGEDLPAFNENSWRFGLDRLMLGYAMGGGTPPFAGILPEPQAAERNSHLLGEFTGFFETLRGWIEFARTDHTIQEWGAAIKKLIKSFFTEDAVSSSLPDALLKAIGLFEDAPVIRISLRTVSSHIKNTLSGLYSRGDFINGTMVFCSMLPMRSVPFRVICLTGMNDRAFPRIIKAPDFDLMSGNPRPGDRSLTDEDRFLFLETLISAKENLYISYTGRSPKDNSDLPPSVVVSELLECIEDYYNIKVSGKKIRDYIFREHRLQPFSREYFSENSNLYSYSEENLSASESQTAKKSGVPFAVRSSSAKIEMPETLQLTELIKFFTNPAAWYLENRLGIDTRDSFFELEDSEPFSVDGLTKFSISREIIKCLIRGDDPAPIRKRALLGGTLPLRSAGEFAIESIESEARCFYETYREYLDSGEPQSANAAIPISGITLTGTVALYKENRIIDYKNSGSKPSDLLAAWIKHLFINASGKTEHPVETIYLRRTRDESRRFTLPADSEKHIADLLDIYIKAFREGPARFFPRTSRAYYDEIIKSGNTQKAINKAFGEWLPNSFSARASESEEAANRLAFRNLNALTTEFEELAMKIYGPLSENEEKLLTRS